jgi:1-acyl-sn-glycerol-3-phosphate acyltransferase
MMNFIRSTLFAIIFYLITLIAVLTAFITVRFGDKALCWHAQHWALLHRWCARWLLGIRTVVEGTIPDGPFLFASKHQSMFETLDLLVILGDPAVVVKRELADLPFFGKVARDYGVIPVDREGSAKELRRMMRAAAAAREAHRRVLIFPEGTRVPLGDQPPLRPGFAGLYKQLRLPVVPIALDSGMVSPRNSFVKKPGIVRMRFGEPIPPGLPRDEIEARVHVAINVLENENAHQSQ